MEKLGNLHSPLGTGKHFYGAAAVNLYRSLTASRMASEGSYRNNKLLDCRY